MIVAAPPPPAALAVSPARVLLRARSGAVVSVANPAAVAVDVRATRTGLAIGRRGRPALDARRTPPAAWLLLSETRFRLPPHSTRRVRLRAGALTDVRAGDHSFVVLFSAVPAMPRRVAVAMRIGIVVTVRAAGRLVRRLTVDRPRLARRRLHLVVRNDGNVDEWLGARRLRVEGRRNGRVVWRWRPESRRVLAKTVAVLRATLPRGRLALAVILDGRRL